MENSITVNGVNYLRVDCVTQAPTGNRAVVVVDRGWIFAGDVAEADGTVTLTRALHVFRWEGIKFTGMLSNPKSQKVTLEPMAYPVEIPVASVIFRVPVSDDWGL